MPSRLAAGLIEALLRALSVWPLPVVHGAGWLLGSFIWLCPNPARRHARINIDVCLPEWSRGQRRRLLRRSLQELGKASLEMGVFWNASPRRLERLVRRVDGWDHVEAAMASGRGMLTIIPHLGAWELLAIYCARYLPANAMYRPPRLALFEPIIRRARERTGCRLWPATPAGVRGAFRVLRAGEVLAVLPDQIPAQEGVYADFFGNPAKTMTLVPRLAHKTGAHVLVLVAERLPRGRGYHVRFRPAPGAIADADIRIGAEAMNRAVEAEVRALPAQYQWTYRRFRDRPAGVASPYRRPGKFADSVAGWNAAGRPDTPQRSRKRRG